MPTITGLVAVFDAKAFSCTDLLKSYIAGENRIVTATGKPTEIATIEVFDKTHGQRFLEESHLFFLICVQKNKHTAPHLCSMCGGLRRSTTWGPRCNSKATTPNAFLSLFCCFPVSLGKSSAVGSWQSSFCLLFNVIKISDLLSMEAVQTCAST